MACDHEIGKSTTFLTTLSHLLPALALIILHFYSSWKNSKFTIQAPFMFLQDNDRNRFLTTVTFGFLSQNILEIVLRQDSSSQNLCSNIEGPEYFLCSFFLRIILSTLKAFTSYPIFVCISSKHLLLSSILGITYTLWEFIKTGLQFHFDCKSDFVEKPSQVISTTAIIYGPALESLYQLYMNWYYCLI